MFPVFCDWLTVRQTWPEGGLPRVNDGQVIAVDADGSVEYLTERRVSLEASYGTRVAVRCDGFTVEVSGNVGRHGRPDNLFGYPLSDCVNRASALVSSLGLPGFTGGKLYRFADSGWTYTGARFSRLDLTCNYWCGSAERMQAVLYHMAAQHVGRQKGTLTPDSGTVLYGYGSRYASGKLYNKAAEMRKHGASPEWAAWCEEQGVLREEVTLKSRYLTETGLCWLGGISDGDCIDAYLGRSQLRRLDTVEYETFNELPRHLRATYASWRDGLPLNLKRATFYRHRLALLPYGIDISVPAGNVSRLPARVRTIEIAALEAPKSYWESHA